MALEQLLETQLEAIKTHRGGARFEYQKGPRRSIKITLFMFRSQVGWLWHRTLSRRSQNGYVDWDRMRRLIDRWLPPLRIYHPYPLHRFFGVAT
jgi:hypothetical protein